MVSLEERLHSYEPLWGQWKVGRRIHAGSQSAVFDLQRVRCDRQLECVIKVIELYGMPRDELEQCFERAVDEIERMELLSGSSHVVSVYDDDIRERRGAEGTVEGYDILIRMERLTCLADLMRDDKVLPEEEIRRAGEDLCQALADAHRLGVVHRDIKPANIFRTGDGRCKLGDFGAAGSFRGGGMLETITGTAAYMAPEVARGNAYGPAADIYSLGVVLYQLLNDNFLPMTEDGSTYSEREEAVRRRQRGVELTPAPRGNQALNAAVLKACSPEASDRFQDAEEFLAAVLASGRTERAADEKKTGTGRNVSLSVAAALCVLCLMAGTALSAVLGTGPGSNAAEGNGTFYPSSQVDDLEDGALNSRYEVVCQNMTWEDARVYCESRGGHLATITSRKEEEIVLKLLDEKNMEAAWIGADNRNSSKGFKWVTDERFAYAAWGLNEPNNALGIEYYLMLINSDTQGWVWNDSREDGLSMFPVEQVGFVCEWDEDQ